MPRYFLRVSLEHLSFRIPSLLSIAKQFNFDITLVSEDLERGVLIIDLEKEEYLNHLLDRATLIISASELFSSGTSYDELHEGLRSNLDAFAPYAACSFKFTVESSNYSILGPRARQLTRSFEYLPLTGPVDLTNPEVEYVIFEDYDFKKCHTAEMRKERDGDFTAVYFARRIGLSRARPLVNLHEVKNRAFYGNTAMESEMGFLTAIQAMPAPGKIIYDPFAGTGSLLYAAARFGAFVLASDIDGRQMRGKTKGKGVVPGMMRAASQYGLEDKFLGCFTFDVTKNPIRRGGWIDAITTDPPYGVRAGAKRLGKRLNKKNPTRDDAYILEDGTPSHLVPTYVPPTRPYELTHLTLDLIRLARYLLVPGGRLVFFLPTVTEEYSEIDIPQVEGMSEIKHKEGSVQNFGLWGRRLITIEKTAVDDGPPPTFDDYDELEGKDAGHKEFNKKYASGFAKQQASRDALLNSEGRMISPDPAGDTPLDLSSSS